MSKISNFFNILIFLIFLVILSSCEALKYKKTEAGEVPINADDRVAKNIEEGRGFRLFDSNKDKGANFDFASSNELWRATLDTIDFINLYLNIIFNYTYLDKNMKKEPFYRKN